MPVFFLIFLIGYQKGYTNTIQKFTNAVFTEGLKFKWGNIDSVHINEELTNPGLRFIPTLFLGSAASWRHRTDAASIPALTERAPLVSLLLWRSLGFLCHLVVLWGLTAGIKKTCKELKGAQLESQRELLFCEHRFDTAIQWLLQWMRRGESYLLFTAELTAHQGIKLPRAMPAGRLQPQPSLARGRPCALGTPFRSGHCAPHRPCSCLSWHWLSHKLSRHSLEA